ncbi:MULTISPECIES: MarR family winged helix-turn-helix transcriptional regulator [Kocuria]|uniref:Putative MarR family transcriptional regulator n=1 Tax=Kocuria rhizophila (strain ATCC 9341 / DSM 348 / NBRC 103217 / DC2201) TaxID=378753 RepID=B2GJC5_KOCRD|nr:MULTISPECIES: MarR family winged helix-turn-helix transcriptional regulator [Kocuria]ASE11627.1 MarR family transcriptional regulator [Kocuria rhizophila]MCC5671872.1 winged helix-turn-helix transcriptional regulator [Kocuria rhizophila]MCC5675330.1 winged helix-turn-helix transcriptional regulator [Kocuria rhizophila]MCT1544793.1 MarR family winged helix-turn-helix transcriptional regulator [Kocuria rhizophila]MCT2171083.1 MarR family winged helix-turn-helix transcriptional regulator [Kocu
MQSEDSVSELVYEHMLLSRYALQGAPPQSRTEALDRSSTVLLARLQAGGPMSVAELAQSFGLDISTVHRQVAAAMKSGLIERIKDPEGGVARKHRPTEEGLRRLEEEFHARRESFERFTRDWSAEDVATLAHLTRRFNESVEASLGHSWPRDYPTES